MKNTIRIAAVLLAVVVFGGCVTKQQYAELELKYKRSQDELTYMTAENQNCQDAKKSLAAQLAALTAEAEKLTADTVRLYRKARTCEMEYEKAQKEYDELLRNFAEVSSSNQSTIDGLLGDRDRYKDELALKEKMLNMQQDSLAKARTELMLKEQRINEMQSILAQKDAEVKALKRR